MKTLQSYRAVLLDFDNTLYNYETTHQKTCKMVFEKLSKKLHVNQKRLAEKYLQARQFFNTHLKNTAASHNRVLYFQKVFESIDPKLSRHAYEASELYWQTYIKNIRLYDGAMELLEALKGKPIVIVTDLTADVQHRKILQLKLWKYVRYLVTSEEAGCEKPSLPIFRLALEKVGLGPKEVCMIGDHYDRDILGAFNCGIDSFWFNPEGIKKQLPKGVREFKSFRELLKGV